MVNPTALTALAAPTPAATPPASTAGTEPGAFARQLERAAQDGEPAESAAPTAAGHAAESNESRTRRLRGPAAHGSSAGTAPRDAKASQAEPSAPPAGPDAPADRQASDAADPPADLAALLAGLLAQAPPPAPTGRPQGTDDPHAGPGGALPGSDDGPSRLRAPADAEASRPASHHEAPAFVLPQGAPLPAGTPAAADNPGRSVGPAHQAQVHAALGTPEFAPGLSAQVSLMVRDGVHEARLHLNPAEMGPITVRIEVAGSQAQVNMTAEHAQTRQALEQALPTLASALRENGLALTGGGVFEQPRPPRDDAPAPGHASRLRGEEAGDELLVPATAGTRIGPARGVVDLYA